MASCKGCIHYDLCKDTVADENWTEEAPEEIKEMFSPKGCENYKSTADVVEVKHGEWHSVNHYQNKASGICSVCHKQGQLRVSRDDWGIWYIDSPYCPACGAKMDGKPKEEE